MGKRRAPTTILETVKSLAEGNATIILAACLVWKAEEAEREKKEGNADGSG